MSELKQEKENYREHAKLHRDRMDINETDFESIISIFLEFFKPKTDQIISAYWPLNKEFDTRFLLDELVNQGFTVALPRMQKDSRILEFVKWTHDTPMKAGAFDVEEPQSDEIVTPDLVLAPLLAFDQKGYRLGYGGGYYDATVEALRENKEITYIGVGYAEQAVLFKLPREAHDIPLDYMLTPGEVIDFERG